MSAPGATCVLDVRVENAWAGQGAVLLDIGGDVGALVVAMPEPMVGTEVEIRPLGAPVHEHHHLQHVAVVRRPVADGTLPSLVFPALEAGGYELFVKGHRGTLALRADVVGGEVTSADWTV
jgi:hypothetical protein